MSVPTSSGSAPKCSALTFQSLPNVKPRMPSFSERGSGLAHQADEEVDDQRQDQRGQRRQPGASVPDPVVEPVVTARDRVSPPGVDAASTAPCLPETWPRRHDQPPGRRRCTAAPRPLPGLGEDSPRQRRVVGLREDRLSLPRARSRGTDDALAAFAARDAGLAEVLVDDDERLRGDREAPAAGESTDSGAQASPAPSPLRRRRSSMRVSARRSSRRLVLHGRDREACAKRVMPVDIPAPLRSSAGSRRPRRRRPSRPCQSATARSCLRRPCSSIPGRPRTGSS